jgi:pimeloyl-ACP methyl ester carboxylesterase
VDAIAQTLLRELPDRFFLAGFSFGGYVALAMHALAPERIEGVALVNSSALADNKQTRELRRRSIERAAAGEHESLTMEQLPLVFHPDNLGNAEIQREFERMIPEYGAERFIAHMEACIARPDRRESLAGTSTPFLLAAARGDRLIPPGVQKTVLEAAEHAVYSEFDGAGHMLPMERPQALAEVLFGWVAQVECMPVAVRAGPRI